MEMTSECVPYYLTSEVEKLSCVPYIDEVKWSGVYIRKPWVKWSELKIKRKKSTIHSISNGVVGFDVYGTIHSIQVG
jgi:hypothetical protein